MNDRPDAGELIEAVRGFLEAELLPALTDGRLRYQTLVALNVLAVARRELATAAAHRADEAGELAALLGEPPTDDVRAANARLCRRIEAGDFDADAGRLLAALRRQVARKLEVAKGRG
ncbi:MAG: DUF6285 domain-containing protein [Gemmataceae bacterium]